MATLSGLETDRVPTGPRDEPELDLLLHWQKRRTPRGWLAIAAGSVLVNLFFATVAVKAPTGAFSPPTPDRQVIVRKTPLYFPHDLLTQKAPNSRPPTKNIDLNDLLAIQASQSRRAAPNPSKRRFEVPQPVAPRHVAKAAPQVPAAAPNVAMNQAPANLPPGTANGLTINAPPPPAPPEQPFQNVGSEPLTNHPTMAVPKATVQSALKSLVHPPAGPQLSINDDNQSQPSLPMPGVNGQNAAQHAAIELQSDPRGADFKEYLARVLSIVRGNWRHVIPESVRLGTLRGRTVVEFIISRDGSIPKLVTADSSGSDALDRAAVAGLSMSNPLPALPADYKGMQVRLAFTFSYNMPSAQ